jgi:hypothetical protein
MAYVILCHKNPDQVNRLIESLENEAVEFFVHVDKKSNIKEKIARKINIHFVEDVVEVYWGHYSQIECIVRSFKLVQQHGYFNYVHVISGQDLPLTSSEKIAEFFERNEGKEFIENMLISKETTPRLYERVGVYYPEFLVERSRIISAIRRRYSRLVMSYPFLQKNVDALPTNLYKGANWLSITGACMDYIMNFIKESPNYVNVFKNSFCGDEIFFQTIVLNSKFKEYVVNDIKRYVDWNTGPDFPRTLTMEDRNRIQLGDYLWGRKFDEDVDKEIIEQILSEVKN